MLGQKSLIENKCPGFHADKHGIPNIALSFGTGSGTDSKNKSQGWLASWVFLMHHEH